MFRIKEGLSLKQEELKHLILDGARTQKQLKDTFYKCESWKSTLTESKNNNMLLEMSIINII